MGERVLRVSPTPPKVRSRCQKQMLRGSRLLLTFLLGMGASSASPSGALLAVSARNAGSTEESPQHATLRPAAATAADIPFEPFDSAAERQLLQLANKARAQAGAPPLAFDEGLSQAARVHAQAMVQAKQLSHQFDGEPSLIERLAATTHLQLDQEGENVAFDSDPEQAQRHLMLSPPHRANLLNPAYNVVGLGVVRSADRLYLVQDFGHALPSYSITNVKDHIAATVAKARHQAMQPDLARRDLPTADDAACSMAHADKLDTSPIQQLAQRYTVLTFTSLNPTLPAGADRAVTTPKLHSFSVGACYARTVTYPAGVYWLVLSLD